MVRIQCPSESVATWFAFNVRVSRWRHGGARDGDDDSARQARMVLWMYTFSHCSHLLGRTLNLSEKYEWASPMRIGTLLKSGRKPGFLKKMVRNLTPVT